MSTPGALRDEDRYARHGLIDWWDQSRIAGARILVAGAGAVGNETAKLLALMGVGHCAVVDFDRIEQSNLSRTILFRDADIGKSKARVAVDRMREINPRMTCDAFDADLRLGVGLGVYRAMDIVIGCLDNLDARLALNQACYRAGVPWIDTGIEAEAAQITRFRGGVPPCFQCGMTDEMWADRNTRFSCSGLRHAHDEAGVPTTATVASIAAGYAVTEALSVIHGRAAGEHLDVGDRLYLTLRPYALQKVRLPQNPDCLAHETWEPIEIVASSPASISILSLLAQIEAPDGTVELGFDLVTELKCAVCGSREELLAPAETLSASIAACEPCGQPTRQAETVSEIEAQSPLATRPLSDLCVPEYAVLAVRSGSRTRYVQLTGEFLFR